VIRWRLAQLEVGKQVVARSAHGAGTITTRVHTGEACAQKGAISYKYGPKLGGVVCITIPKFMAITGSIYYELPVPMRLMAHSQYSSFD
jgi:hypothetical protein